MKTKLSPHNSAPLYMQVANLLEQEIDKGTYRIGMLLPPEATLAEELGVSRYTLREAIARLRRAGRLSARKGVGTRVEAANDTRPDRFRAQSRDDLFDLARESEFHIQTRKEITARGKLAVDLGCRTGKVWAYYNGVRHFSGGKTPYCWHDVYLEPRFAVLLNDVDVLRSALFMLIESQTGERIEEIQQEIRPVMIEGAMAQALEVEDGSLGLKLTRRFLGSGRRLLELAVQTLPEDRFVYRSTLSSSTDPFAPIDS